MINRSMQEWADFTGCYLTKTEKSIILHKSKPTENTYGVFSSDFKTEIIMPDDFVKEVNDFNTHDREVIVEPHSCENCSHLKENHCDGIFYDSIGELCKRESSDYWSKK